MSQPSTQRPPWPGQAARRTLCALAALVMAGAACAQGAGRSHSHAQEGGPAASGAPRNNSIFLRVLATRSHMQCPLPGKNTKLLSIDSPGEWDDTIERQDELTALGRKVRWSNERVLIYAMESQKTGGVRLEAPTRVIRLAQGVLYWPVRQLVLDQEPGRPSSSTRPCVFAVIDRAFWQHIKVVPTRP